MLVPLTWLREYVTVDAPIEELADRINTSVAGVERVVRRGVFDDGGNLGLYRVGRVVNVTGNGYLLTGRNLFWNGTELTGAANGRLA